MDILHRPQGRPAATVLSRCAFLNSLLTVSPGLASVLLTNTPPVHAEEAMEPQVLAWDDRRNNVWLNSGTCSMISTPINAYIAARKDKTLLPGTDKLIHLVLHHILPPRGLAGRYMSAAPNDLGVWECSPMKDLAKEFPGFHFSKANYEKPLVASEGYKQSSQGNSTLHAVYATTLKYDFHPYIALYSHAPGWPGSPTAAAEVVWDKCIMPDTVALCAIEKARAEEAGAEAEKALKRLYQRYVKG